jgi:hypothetical protein
MFSAVFRAERDLVMEDRLRAQFNPDAIHLATRSSVNGDEVRVMQYNFNAKAVYIYISFESRTFASE